MAAAGVAEQDRHVVPDEFAAAVGEDWGAVGEARPLLLAAASRKPSDAAAVWKHGAPDCGLADASRLGLGAERRKFDQQK